jgi:murein L,D-transpeptidase YafK
MKGLLVHGTPRKEGCTYTALCTVSDALNPNGILL